jgi:hypothetical protein
MNVEILPVPEFSDSPDGVWVYLYGTLIYEKDGKIYRHLAIRELPENSSLKDVTDLLGLAEPRIGLVVMDGVLSKLTDIIPPSTKKLFFCSPVAGG